MVQKEGIMGKNETMQLQSSDVAVLLLIPENVYMAKMFARHKNKQQTKEKVCSHIIMKQSFVLEFVDSILSYFTD